MYLCFTVFDLRIANLFILKISRIFEIIAYWLSLFLLYQVNNFQILMIIVFELYSSFFLNNESFDCWIIEKINFIENDCFSKFILTFY